MGAERNYARFYALLKRLPGADKETLVYQYTNGRTTHLHETTLREYDTMCNDMERVAGYDERMEAVRKELRRRRSVCLKLMQQAGIDTTDWQRINDFCRHPKIAGKAFARLSLSDLDTLQTKLRTIMRKGGLKAHPRPLPREGRSGEIRPGSGVAIVFPISNIAES